MESWGVTPAMKNTSKERKLRGEAGGSSGTPLPRTMLLMLCMSGAAIAGPARGGESAILGRVLSGDTGQPMPYATLALTALSSATDTVGTPSGGVLSRPDGSYRIPVAPGFYRVTASYISYTTKRIDAIEVAEGSSTELDIVLSPSTVRMETIEVRSYAIENSEAAILIQQKRAPAVSDGVSSQQIARTSDFDAAEVLQRVTGLSIVGGRYVYVRGLGERYSSTQINGTTIGTPEPNKRVVPLDLFASSLLDNIVVQKTYTPDQPGEFGGGVVSVNTRDFPGERVFDLSFSTGYNSETTGKDFYTYRGGGLDFLGIDDGTRVMPDIIKKLAGHTPVKLRGVGGLGFSPDTVALFGDSFKEIWGKRTKRPLPNYSMSATLGDELTLFEQPFGYLGSVTLSNDFQSYDSVERFYLADGGELFAETDYDVTTSTASTLWGMLGNASYRLNGLNTIALRTMYNRTAENTTRSYSGENNDSGRPVSNTRLQFVERGVFSGSMASSHSLPGLGDASLDLRFSYSRATRNEPDRREYNYELFTDYVYDSDDEIIDTTYVWRLSRRTASHGFTRMFGEMNEEERGPEAHLTVPFRQWGHLDAKVTTGLSFRNKDRDSGWRRFYFKPNLNVAGRDSLLALPPEDLMTEERIGTNQDLFLLEELTRGDSDNYRAHSDITAGFVMVDLPVTRKLRSVVGARLERAELRVESYDIFGLAPDSLLSKAHLDDTDLLPSVNLTYSPREDTNVRVGYSTTVSRPDFRELSDFYMVDFTDGFAELGNPDLERARVHSYDVRLETFPEPTEMLAVSVFYKDLDRPIESILRLAGAEQVYQPVNAKDGRLYGAELESRLALGRLTDSLDRFGANVNLTLVESSAETDGGVGTSKERPLQGQSPYVVNAGLFFTSTSGKLSASVLYNVFGKRLSKVGAFGLPDIYEQPRNSLDLTVGYHLGGRKLKLAIENLMNDEVLFKQKGGVVHSSKRGVGVSLGFSTGS